MYVKSIIIDGFKSYGRRTEINGFDPTFNAITGLNGSGKSNILDAICFVLGITNLSNVRATSLQDLVYKQGQANINKASVSVTFDNSEVTQRPPGYEDQEEIVITRQVVIGGKNKYMINGMTVQNNRVQDLFRSVQLNVNNPHFLIMQGRITKVLNMKPLEILSMVEEAAGTRLYKTKKEQSMKTLEKKDLKLAEIDRQLQEVLEPRISKLQEERQQYQELMKLSREFEQLSRVHIAFKFHEAEKSSVVITKDLQDIAQKIGDTEKAIVDGQQETIELEATIKKLREQKDKEGKSLLQEAEKSLAEAEKEEAILLAREKGAQDNLKAEERRQVAVIKNIATDEGLLKKKEAVLEKGRGEYSKMEEETQRLTVALEDARKRHQAASMGKFVDKEGNASSLQQQLIDVQKAMIASQSETKELQLKMEPLKVELKSKRDQLKQAGGNLGQEQNQLQGLEKNVATLQKELEKLQGSVTQRQELTARYDTVSKDIRRLTDQVNSQLRGYHRATFEFSDPEPNFDRRQVRGLVCRLFKVKDKVMATALENVAGGKLYNVITQTDSIAKKLIAKKCVAQRVTYMPLNKVTPHSLNPSVIRNARRHSGDNNVWTAMELIEFAPDLRPAMESVFGGSLVCRDLRIAKVLAYQDGVRARCVTLDGDIVEPSGTMSGGAPSRSKPILSVLAGLQSQEEQLEALKAEEAELRGQLRQLEGAVERHDRLQGDLDTKSHQATLLRTRIEQSAHGRLELEMKALEAEIGTNTVRLEELKGVERTATQQHKELETKVKQSKALAEKELKAAEKEMKSLQAELDKGREKWEQCEQKFKTLELEIQELRETINAARQDIEASAETLEKMQSEIEKFKKQLIGITARVKELQQEVQRQKEVISRQNRELQSKVSRVEQLAADAGEHDLLLKQLRNTQEKRQAENKAVNSQLTHMLNNNDWIAKERRLFNQPGNYDFTAIPLDKVKERLTAIDSRRKNLEKRTNMQAVNILTVAENQLKDLRKKKTLVEKDRSQLLTVIRELDKKMVGVLETAWKNINRDFGQIFSTLLKGADAKLVSTSGSSSVLEGLEVRVGFNGKWKDSLGELSGGQRSLVALSLILAMLLFKPAPIYILDEVDAALDPSHTENIGNIIQSHFKQSQFIIVSLKEGMFNNANVLFRTKFVDGMSTVSRNVQKHKAGGRH